MSSSNNPSGVSLDRPPYAWGYARASTEKQQITNEAQEQQILKYYSYKLSSEGIAWGFCFKDEAETSRIPWSERRQGKFLFEIAQPGDHILVAVHDRPFRSMKDAMNTIEHLTSNDIKVHFLNLNLDLSDPMGMAMFQVVMAFAQLERGMISKRTKEALAWKRGRGLPTCSAVPVGWSKVGVKRDSRFVPSEKNRAICYMVVELRDKEKKTFHEISIILRRRGVFYSRSKMGRRINPVDEISLPTVKSLYRAAKNGFPLPNGARQHVFHWEPALWRKWGIDYDESKPHDFQITVSGKEDQSVVEGVVQQE